MADRPTPSMASQTVKARRWIDRQRRTHFTVGGMRAAIDFPGGRFHQLDAQAQEILQALEHEGLIQGAGEERWKVVRHG